MPHYSSDKFRCYHTKRAYRLRQKITQACVHFCKLNLEEINEIKNRPIMIPTFSLHTQSCERAVQEVTKSTCEVHGEKRRDGWVRARIAHREFMPVFNSKKDIANM